MAGFSEALNQLGLSTLGKKRRAKQWAPVLTNVSKSFVFASDPSAWRTFIRLFLQYSNTDTLTQPFEDLHAAFVGGLDGLRAFLENKLKFPTSAASLFAQRFYLCLKAEELAQPELFTVELTTLSAPLLHPLVQSRDTFASNLIHTKITEWVQTFNIPAVLSVSLNYHEKEEHRVLGIAEPVSDPFAPMNYVKWAGKALENFLISVATLRRQHIDGLEKSMMGTESASHLQTNIGRLVYQDAFFAAYQILMESHPHYREQLASLRMDSGKQLNISTSFLDAIPDLKVPKGIKTDFVGFSLDARTGGCISLGDIESSSKEGESVFKLIFCQYAASRSLNPPLGSWAGCIHIRGMDVQFVPIVFLDPDYAVCPRTEWKMTLTRASFYQIGLTALAFHMQNIYLFLRRTDIGRRMQAVNLQNLTVAGLPDWERKCYPLHPRMLAADEYAQLAQKELPNVPCSPSWTALRKTITPESIVDPTMTVELSSFAIRATVVDGDDDDDNVEVEAVVNSCVPLGVIMEVQSRMSGVLQSPYISMITLLSAPSSQVYLCIGGGKQAVVKIALTDYSHDVLMRDILRSSDVLAAPPLYLDVMEQCSFSIGDHTVMVMRVVSPLPYPVFPMKMVQPLLAWFKEVLPIMKKLEIVHCDIKPSNIFFEQHDDTFRFYLGDWELGSMAHSTCPVVDVGTFRPPYKLWDHDGDRWCAGVTLAMLIGLPTTKSEEFILAACQSKLLELVIEDEEIRAEVMKLLLPLEQDAS